MRKSLAYIYSFFMCAGLLAQAPQIPLTGNIGVQGSVAVLGGVTVSITDANFTLSPAQWANKTLIITSSATLSATRNIVAPLNKGQEYNVQNKTTGGQSIVIIGATGTGVTVTSGTSATVFSDGVNYIQSSTGNAATATAFDHTPAPCTGGQLAGGVDASGNSINCASASGALPNITGAVFANGLSAPTVQTTTQANAAIGKAVGLFFGADSIGCSTGASSTGVGNFAITNGFPYLVQPAVGGPFQNNCNPGDQTVDTNWKFIARATQPQGGGIDPVYVIEDATNDTIYYLANTNQQQIMQRAYLFDIVQQGIPLANKKLAQSCTLAGGMAAQVAPLQAGQSVTSTTNGATASCVISAPKAGDTLYACYSIADTSVATLTISVDGTPQTDTFNGTTTWSSFGDGGALIQTHNGTKNAVVCGRFTNGGAGYSAGNHTILFTNTGTTGATNVVTPEFVAAAPVASVNNPYVIAVSPNQQQVGSAGQPYTATYAGFISTLVTNTSADGINAFYADTSNALLNDATCGNGVQAAMFANCYADTIHPSNPGHAVMAKTITALIPAAKKLGVTVQNATQPIQNYIPTYPISPYDFFDLNRYNLVGDTTHWVPGLKFQGNNGQVSWMGFQFNTGLTIGFPNGTTGFSLCPSGGSGFISGLPPVLSACSFVQGNGQINMYNGTWGVQNNLVTVASTATEQVLGTHKVVTAGTAGLSGVYSNVLATSSVNGNSPCYGFNASVWDAASTGTAGFSGPCLQAVPITPTPGGQKASVYLKLVQQAGVAAVGLDLSASLLTNHLGPAADVTAFAANSFTLNGQLMKKPLFGTTPAIGGSSLAAGACATDFATVSGASSGLIASGNPTAGNPGALIFWRVFISGVNTVEVDVCNLGTTSATPISMTYAVAVEQP